MELGLLRLFYQPGTVKKSEDLALLLCSLYGDGKEKKI